MEKVDTTCTILNNVFPIDLPEKLDKNTCYAWTNVARFMARKNFDSAVQWAETIGNTKSPTEKFGEMAADNVRAFALAEIIYVQLHKNEEDGIDKVLNYLKSTNFLSNEEREYLIAKVGKMQSDNNK